ncbi:MAG: 3-hydroxylacyl-ACP dehydratase [Pseudomonadota bacterium]|nr:3-hydroxylacyl-ACP dehydratase [Pseudomonadota bacterium]
MNEQPLFKAPSHYLAHRAPMLLIDEVLDVGHDFARCRVGISPDCLFADAQGVGSWVGIEFMAQTIAVYAGWLAEQASEPVKMGFLLGTRRFESDFPRFAFGEVLEVSVSKSFAQENGLSVFSCTLSGPRGEQRAQLTVYQPEDASHLLAGEQP